MVGNRGIVVVATAKVQIFKQITTLYLNNSVISRCCCYRKGTNFQANHNPSHACCFSTQLLLLPQRYKFSSKSQLMPKRLYLPTCCCCYRKGTNFQANHNGMEDECGDCRLLLLPQRYKFSSKSQLAKIVYLSQARCCCYRKGTNFQANHNRWKSNRVLCTVVVATAKVQIFKQITTAGVGIRCKELLLLLPQRYKFSSKSQPLLDTSDIIKRCCCYRKGTNFQANHNLMPLYSNMKLVVVATAKVQIFKQITTVAKILLVLLLLLLLPQRYKFSSKSQHKLLLLSHQYVVVATAKVQIFKQITTNSSRDSCFKWLLLLPQRYKFSSKSQLTGHVLIYLCMLLLLPQRYKFSSKSQQVMEMIITVRSCCCYRKGTNFQANHNVCVLVF